jgi:hypothetical protein
VPYLSNVGFVKRHRTMIESNEGNR